MFSYQISVSCLAGGYSSSTGVFRAPVFGLYVSQRISSVATRIACIFLSTRAKHLLCRPIFMGMPNTIMTPRLQIWSCLFPKVCYLDTLMRTYFICANTKWHTPILNTLTTSCTTTTLQYVSSFRRDVVGTAHEHRPCATGMQDNAVSCE